MNRVLNIAGLSVMLAVAMISCQRAGVTIGKSNSPSTASRQGPPAHAPAHGYRRKFGYHYYPDQHVYYAPDRGTYFWLEGEAWKVGVELPSRIALNLGDHVSIELDSQTPYKQHATVARKHPGKGKGRGKGRGKSHAQGKRDW